MQTIEVGKAGEGKIIAMVYRGTEGPYISDRVYRLGHTLPSGRRRAWNRIGERCELWVTNPCVDVSDQFPNGDISYK